MRKLFVICLAPGLPHIALAEEKGVLTLVNAVDAYPAMPYAVRRTTETYAFEKVKAEK